MTEGNFTDWVKIHLKSGKGGRGSSHLRREKFVPKGGPDGGDGGRGGHIIFRGNSQLWTLYHFKFKQHFKADHGSDGGKSRSTGADGSDIYIDIPVGTIIKDSETTSEVLYEITEEGQEFIALTGGKGGKGNWHFKSSTRQTPRYAQPGLEGEEKSIILELKVLADVGLVGFPNAGKSTLLSAITSAKPKIADYEFTTLKPNLGIVNYRDYRSFVMADIPGIIEGAAEGKGLGHRFLRHIERNAVLLFIIPIDSPDIVVEYNILINELASYNPELLDKEHLLAISKIDMIDDELELEAAKELSKRLPNTTHLFISSVSQKGLEKLKDVIWQSFNK